MKIKIGIITDEKRYSIYADESTQDFSVGIQKLQFSKDFLNRAINIVKDWPDHVENHNVTDGVNFKVTYNDGIIERTITGVNETPDDFIELMSLIHEYSPKTREEQIRNLNRDWMFGQLK